MYVRILPKVGGIDGIGLISFQVDSGSPPPRRVTRLLPVR
jgi:hypothetical protein